MGNEHQHARCRSGAADTTATGDAAAPAPGRRTLTEDLVYDQGATTAPGASGVDLDAELAAIGDSLDRLETELRAIRTVWLDEATRDPRTVVSTTREAMSATLLAAQDRFGALLERLDAPGQEAAEAYAGSWSRELTARISLRELGPSRFGARQTRMLGDGPNREKAHVLAVLEGADTVADTIWDLQHSTAADPPTGLALSLGGGEQLVLQDVLEARPARSFFRVEGPWWVGAARAQPADLSVWECLTGDAATADTQDARRQHEAEMAGVERGAQSELEAIAGAVVRAMEGGRDAEVRGAIEPLRDQPASARQALIAILDLRTLEGGAENATTAKDRLQLACPELWAELAAGTSYEGSDAHREASYGVEVLLRTLELACQAAGVEPAELERFLGNAQETLQILIDRPGQFVGNLGAAVERGFEQFGAAFPDHLQRAFLDFLAESGLRIHIPSEMSWGAVFGVALEVLGLDGEALRGRLEERIGEAHVERLDAAWQVIEAGIDGGWAGVWSHLEGEVMGVISSMVDEVRDWLLDQVIQRAIQHVAMLAAPGGQLVEAVRKIWEVSQFVVERLRELTALAMSVVESMHDVATGELDGAANRVEGALASALGLAVKLLADILEIDDLGERVQGAIERIRRPIERAVDVMIDRVADLVPATRTPDEREEGAAEEGAAAGLAEQEAAAEGETAAEGEAEAGEGGAPAAEVASPRAAESKADVVAEADDLERRGLITDSDWARVYSAETAAEARRILDECVASHRDAAVAGGDYHELAAALERDGVVPTGTADDVAAAGSDRERHTILHGALERSRRITIHASHASARADYDHRVSAEPMREVALVELRVGSFASADGLFGVVEGERCAVPYDNRHCRIRAHNHPTRPDGSYLGATAMPSPGDIEVGLRESRRSGRQYAQEITLTFPDGQRTVPLIVDAQQLWYWFEVPTPIAGTIHVEYARGTWRVQKGDHVERERTMDDVIQRMNLWWTYDPSASAGP